MLTDKSSLWCGRRTKWLPGFILFFLLVQIWLNYRQPHPYMDELYHYPAANTLCGYFFGGQRKTELDAADWSMITTPPGAYMFGCVPCYLWQRVQGRICPLWLWRILMGTLPLTLVAYELLSMPNVSLEDTAILCTFLPLFFAGQLCYTDSLALWWFVRAWRKQLGQSICSPWQSASCGVLATITRQPYLIWHAYLGWVALIRSRGNRRKRAVIAHGTAGSIYCFFLIWQLAIRRKGIYFGDSQRHELAWHWSNCLYFSAAWFLLAGGWRMIAPSVRKRSSVISALQQFLHTFRRHCLRTMTLCLCATVAITWGTYVHPFVLADNRHYVFYFFRYFILPNRWSRYLLLPVYIVSISFWMERIQTASTSECVGISLATALTLVPSRLVEMRYFIPPVVSTEMLTSKKENRLMDTVGMLLNLVLVATCISIFLERPFARPPDQHIQDLSPGRFMP